jgi:aspartate/glutamate racemase
MSTLTINVHPRKKLTVTQNGIAIGPRGHTPYIQDGNWWINGEDTGVRAEGIKWSDLTSEQKDELKLKFEYLTPEQKAEIKGEKGDQGIQGPKGDQGIQGIQGEKGDPFTYSDFTQEQIDILQKPATDAAAIANQAADSANDAATAANATNEDIQEAEGLRVAAETARNVASNMYNVTLAIPLAAGQYYTSTTARAAVPEGVRKIGLIITYETSAGAWLTERFKGVSISTWVTATDWEEIVGPLKYENMEEVAAEALVLLKNRIDALQKIINDMILGTVQIDTLSVVKTFNLFGSSNLILTGTAAPVVVPDFVGQFFIKTSDTTACYQATGNSSVNNWKQIG